MDLAMDIAASMEEIKINHPKITWGDHLSSGLRVGRAALGTMATTLLLAYSISHSTMFMFFMAKGLPPVNILNAPFISAELLNILIGSFGLIAVAPLTALISALFCRIDPVVEPATAGSLVQTIGIERQPVPCVQQTKGSDPPCIQTF